MEKRVAIETDYQRIKVNRQSVEYQLDEMKTQKSLLTSDNSLQKNKDNLELATTCTALSA